MENTIDEHRGVAFTWWQVRPGRVGWRIIRNIGSPLEEVSGEVDGFKDEARSGAFAEADRQLDALGLVAEPH